MTHLRNLLLATCLLCISGCNRGYQAFAPPGDKIYEESQLDMSDLEAKGEKYTRRGNTTTDVSDLSPREGESYETYRQRMAYTLNLQEDEIEQLETLIQQKKRSVSSLDQQISAAGHQEAEMRLALSGHKPGDNDSAYAAARRLIPFERYRVKKGDTLQKIGYEHYGTYTAWLGLYRMNHKALPHGPNQLEEGIELLLPNVAE